MPDRPTYDNGGLRLYLLSLPEVTTIVGTRVWANEMPDAEARNMPRAAILVNSAGLGSRLLIGRSNIPIIARTKDIRCYGATLYESRRLFDVVHVALKALNRKRIVDPTNDTPPILLYSAVSAGGVFTNREPESNWPVSFGTYDVTASEVG